MALKNFGKLTSRSQSTLVSQLHQLISYYGEIFCPRERVYLKSLTKSEDTIYWLEDEEKKLSAAALLDPNYRFKLNDVEIQTLGHTVSKRPGQMDRILTHIFSDYEDQSILLLCRPAIANGIQSNLFGLKALTPLQLIDLWPELASLNTDYFNTKKETFAHGLDRKQYFAYLKLSNKDTQTLSSTHPDLVKFLSE